MLELSSLSVWLEGKLNYELGLYTQENETILKADRVEYRFRIYTDSGEHKGYDYLDAEGNITNEMTNRIVRYIEAILTQTDSEVEATTYTSIARNTQLEILIPLNDYIEVDLRKQIVEEIRKVMDTAFSKNGDAYLLGDDGEIYKFNYKYSLTTTGNRNTRAYAGDSLTMYAFINFFYVQDGVPSSNFKIYIDGEEITPLRIGFNRGISQQTNTYSNDASMTALNTPTQSMLSINFDLVARDTGFCITLYRHLVKGTGISQPAATKPNVAHLVKLGMLIRDIDAQGNVTETLAFEIYKLMSIENVALNGQIPLMASYSATLTETKYVEGLTPISPEAYAKLDNILAEQTGV